MITPPIDGLEGNVYRTESYFEACYYYSSGLLFQGFELNPNENQRGNFVFQIPEGVDFPALHKLWHSPSTESVRDLLRKARILKDEIRRTHDDQRSHRTQN